MNTQQRLTLTLPIAAALACLGLPALGRIIRPKESHQVNAYISETCRILDNRLNLPKDACPPRARYAIQTATGGRRLPDKNRSLSTDSEITEADYAAGLLGYSLTHETELGPAVLPPSLEGQVTSVANEAMGFARRFANSEGIRSGSPEH